MHIEVGNLRSEVLCAFLSNEIHVSNKTKILHNPKYKDQLIPIINETPVNRITSLTYKNISDVTGTINTYGGNGERLELKPELISQKKIAIKTNDLGLGPISVILNCSTHRVTIYDSTNLPRSYAPIENIPLLREYTGKIILLQTHRLNNPALVSSGEYPASDYLADMLARLSKSKGTGNAKLDDLYDVADYAKRLFDTVDRNDPEYKFTNIFVVTISVLPLTDLFSKENGSHKALIITNKNIMVTLDSINNFREFPDFRANSDISAFKSMIMSGVKIVFIVDKNNILRDRWFNVFGETVCVPKFKSTNDLPDGLYRYEYNKETGTFDPTDTVVPLNEIDTKIPYIYKSKEEAEIGSDKSEIYAAQVKRTELEYKEKEILLRKTLEENRAKLETEIQENNFKLQMLKNSYEAEAKEREAAFIRMKNELEQEAMRNKIKHDENKFRFDENNYNLKGYYDREKYRHEYISQQKESYIETLKTIAATAGVITAGYLLFTKLQKA